METVEAVIISGPRKGEIARFDGNGEPQLSPAEEAMLDLAVQRMQSAARHAEELTQTTHGIKRTLDNALSNIIQDLRERVTRLEVWRDTDRAQLEATLAQFRLEVERA